MSQQLPHERRHSNHTKLAKSITKSGAQAAAIPVSVPGHTIRVNVMLDESLLGRIDREPEARGQSRSGFLAEAAKTLLRSAGAVTATNSDIRRANRRSRARRLGDSRT